MQEQLPRVTMHGLEKSVREPENTTLKAPASKNSCNVRVYRFNDFQYLMLNSRFITCLISGI
jgi:hypothetical protein